MWIADPKYTDERAKNLQEESREIGSKGGSTGIWDGWSRGGEERNRQTAFGF